MIILVLIKNINYTLIYNVEIDILFRLESNDSLYNYYSFFWTNFWYIPIFFFSLVYLNKYFFYVYEFSIWFLSIFYLYEIYDLSLSNWSYSILKNTQTFLNVLLNNNINKIHPFIFYEASAWFLLIYLLTKSFFVNKNTWRNIKILILINQSKLLGFLMCLLALFLGSWWALQEGTWGGWWGWDASEVFGLVLLLIYFRLIHVKSIKINFWYFYLYILITLKYFLVLYILMQLNFDLVSHNFGIKFFFFFNNSLFFIEFLIVIFILLKTNFKIFSILYLTKKLFFKSKYNLVIYFKLLIYILYFWGFISLIFFGSYGSLLSYFLWFYFSINFLNEIGIQLLKNISVICFLIFLIFSYVKKWKKYTIFTFFYNSFLIELFCLNFYRNFFLKIHIWFLGIFFLTHQTTYLYLSTNSTCSHYLPSIIHDNLSWFNFSTFNFNGPIILNHQLVYKYIFGFLYSENFNSFIFLPIFGFLLNIFNFYYFLFLNTETFIYLTCFELSLFSNFFHLFFFLVFYNLFIFFYKNLFWVY